MVIYYNYVESKKTNTLNKSKLCFFLIKATALSGIISHRQLSRDVVSGVVAAVLRFLPVVP